MKMKNLLILFMIFLACHSAPIVMKQAPSKEATPNDIDWKGKLHYEHYLTEVMTELEKDKAFGKRLEEMRKNSSIKTEDLATQLTFAKHSVRTRLDELKRLELRRLSELERRLDILKAKRGDKDVPEEIKRMIDRGHVDHENPSSFEIDDLQRLIKRAVSDLHILDQKQKEEFRRHEMEKEILHKRKVKHIKDPKKKQEEEKKWEESQTRHNKHEKIHTPGSEAQLKEVWEKEDNLDPKDFDSRTFFKIHDLNGDGELDETEIDAILQKELDKAYDPNNPDDDMQEKYESMMEMREKIMKKIDKNNDLRISFDELQQWSKSPEFKKDEGFKLAEEDKHKLFNEEDLKKYEEEYDREHPDDMDDEDYEHHDAKPHEGTDQNLKFPAHGDPAKKESGHHGKQEQGKHHDTNAEDSKVPVHAEVPKKDPNRKTVGKQRTEDSGAKSGKGSKNDDHVATKGDAHGTKESEKHGVAGSEHHEPKQEEHRDIKASEHRDEKEEHHDAKENEHHDPKKEEHHETKGGKHDEAKGGEHHETKEEHHEAKPGEHHEAKPGEHHEAKPGEHHEAKGGEHHETKEEHHEAKSGEHHEAKEEHHETKQPEHHENLKFKAGKQPSAPDHL